MDVSLVDLEASLDASTEISLDSASDDCIIISLKRGVHRGEPRAVHYLHFAHFLMFFLKTPFVKLHYIV
jgi:hypothetical protein